jgi:predicted small lipoprotein YifL
MQLKRNFLVICVIMILALSLTACSETGSPPNENTPGGISEEENENINQPDGEQEQEQGNQEGKEKELILQIMELAKQGRVIGCNYVAGKTVFDDVEKEWGKQIKVTMLQKLKVPMQRILLKVMFLVSIKGPRYLKSEKSAIWKILPFPRLKRFLAILIKF